MGLHDGIIDIGQGFREIVSGVHNHRAASFFTSPIMYLMIKQLRLKKVLEIGTGSASAGYWLGHAAKEMGGIYYGVDILQGRANGIKKWMDQFGIENKVWCADTKELPLDFFSKNIGAVDFVYLDGDHSKEAILHEIDMIWPILRSNGDGYLCIHDILSASREGWAAVKEIVEEGKLNA